MLALTYCKFLLQGLHHISLSILYRSHQGSRTNSPPFRDGLGEGLYFHIYINLSALLRDIVVVQKYTTAGCSRRFAIPVLLQRVGDMHLRASYEPHVTIHTAMICEVQLTLLLSRRIALVVAVVGLHGNETAVTGLNTSSRQVDDDRQIASLMLIHETAVDIYPLLAHDGLEMHDDVLPCHIFGHDEVLPVPAYTLIVTAAAGLGRHQLHGMGGADHRPRAIVVVCPRRGRLRALPSVIFRHIAHQEPPPLVEVIQHTPAALKWEEPRHTIGRSRSHIDSNHQQHKKQYQ